MDMLTLSPVTGCGGRHGNDFKNTPMESKQNNTCIFLFVAALFKMVHFALELMPTGTGDTTSMMEVLLIHPAVIATMDHQPFQRCNLFKIRTLFVFPLI